ncbi:MAG: TetR/AcrR family transcriptional regulator [Alphaproteobacteria bacterium]|nr:TetR/AcrR family transcriptional regulator [Alphaproteobacteria bacterium]MDF1626240.1 TetR/AcrR family transcriptional regulator [Parvibaculaceae bacterium]
MGTTSDKSVAQEPETGPKSDADARILAAATMLFARDGFASVKVPEIAAVAKVGLNTLYQRYPSKEVLGNAVFRHCKKAWEEAVLTDWPEQASSREQFLFYWNRLSDFAARERNIALYNERKPLGHPYDAQSQALHERLEKTAITILKSWSAESGLSPDIIKAIINGTFQRLLEMDVDAAERARLLKEAGPAVWAALARR